MARLSVSARRAQICCESFNSHPVCHEQSRPVKPSWRRLGQRAVAAEAAAKGLRAAKPADAGWGLANSASRWPWIVVRQVFTVAERSSAQADEEPDGARQTIRPCTTMGRRDPGRAGGLRGAHALRRGFTRPCSAIACYKLERTSRVCVARRPIQAGGHVGLCQNTCGEHLPSKGYRALCIIGSMVCHVRKGRRPDDN